MAKATEGMIQLFFFEHGVRKRELENVINVFRYFDGRGYSAQVADVLAEALLASERLETKALFEAVMDNLVKHIRAFFLRDDIPAALSPEEQVISTDPTIILFYRIHVFILRTNPVKAIEKCTCT